MVESCEFYHLLELEILFFKMVRKKMDERLIFSPSSVSIFGIAKFDSYRRV